MPLQVFPSVTRLPTKHTLGMRSFHMGLQKNKCGKSDSSWVTCLVSLGSALLTPKPVFSMVPFLMSPQSTSRVKTLPTNGSRFV
ncbi:hypothetical protein RRF57_007684 [Xylaria bambusicola]|uniref:Uncharacterized protein n=1 Tax=Xylaria bambusicola TaxID=326684 RepID=A0AAN7Z006_9PEZI